MAKKSPIIPQLALSQVARDEVHLQFNFKKGFSIPDFKKALAKVWSAEVTGINDPTLQPRHKRAGDVGINVVGFRPEIWRDQFEGSIPDNLQSFTEDIVGINGKIAPATQCDLWVWVTHISPSSLYDSVAMIRKILDPFVTLVSEQVCFPYYNNVTFDGFADGVANPGIFEAPAVAIIPDGEPGAGGITALVQKWTMEVDKLKELHLHEAEKLYGREKLSSKELDPQPVNSHVSRNKLYRNGEEVDIVRRNANYRNQNDMGIMFIGLSKDITVTLGMLKQMYGVGDDGVKVTDRLIDFSTALSSANYFIPSITDLIARGIQPVNQDDE